jgi:universal stress protein E
MSDHKSHPSVLAATNLTEQSDQALATAAALAARGAEVHVIHCVAKPWIPFWESDIDEGYRAARLAEARAQVDAQLSRVLGKAPLASTEVVMIDAHRGIMQRAAEVGADWIVLGGHRSRGPFADLLGTTADRVIRTSTLPCLIASRALETFPRHVLVPTDFSRHLLSTRYELASTGCRVSAPVERHPL